MERTLKWDDTATKEQLEAFVAPYFKGWREDGSMVFTHRYGMMIANKGETLAIRDDGLPYIVEQAMKGA